MMRFWRVEGNLFFMLLGLLIGWLLGQKPATSSEAVRAASHPVRRSREPFEMSPTLKILHNAKQSIYDVDDNQIHQYLWNIAHEMIQPGMTELEAAQAARELGQIMQAMKNYNAIRERRVEYSSERWIDELAEQR